MEEISLRDALDLLVKEKNINRDSIIEAIKHALYTACKNDYKTADGRQAENFRVDMDPETCEYHVYAVKTVVETVMPGDEIEQISLAEAKAINEDLKPGDTVDVPIESKNLHRIATNVAKNDILQKIREEERSAVYKEYHEKEHQLVTGIVQRYIGKNLSINLGDADAILTEKEQIKSEHYEPTDRIKVYIIEVKDTSKGPRIRVSRTHPELIRCLFEEEVAEVRDGTVEIRSIAREAGNRTKIAVYSNDPDVDPVGACVGINGSRVNNIVKELGNEKIDIIEWSDNPAMLIENALSPAKVISVIADSDEHTAKVVVPDYQLSLAIGREGQNARLAARLTGFKIDIKSETQARESGDFPDYGEDYDEDDEYYDDEEYSEDAEDAEYSDEEYTDEDASEDEEGTDEQ